jgi:hypothetical protein
MPHNQENPHPSRPDSRPVSYESALLSMDQKSERIVAQAKNRLYLAKPLLLEKAAALATSA